MSDHELMKDVLQFVVCLFLGCVITALLAMVAPQTIPILLGFLFGLSFLCWIWRK